MSSISRQSLGLGEFDALPQQVRGVVELTGEEIGEGEEADGHLRRPELANPV
jgi:hypothetical protein